MLYTTGGIRNRCQQPFLVELNHGSFGGQGMQPLPSAFFREVEPLGNRRAAQNMQSFTTALHWEGWCCKDS